MKMRYKGNSLTVPLVPRCVVRNGCFSVIVLGKVRENGGIGQIVLKCICVSCGSMTGIMRVHEQVVQQIYYNSVAVRFLALDCAFLRLLFDNVHN